MLALEGDDVVLARGGPDTVNGGPGNDRVTVDPGGIDATSACESVAVGVAPGLPGAAGAAGPGSQARRKVAASLKGPKRQKLVGAAVTLRLACPILSCAARATAATRFRPGAGPKRHRVTLLPAKVRAVLAAGRHPVVRVTVVVTDAAAATRTLRRAISLIP